MQTQTRDSCRHCGLNGLERYRSDVRRKCIRCGEVEPGANDMVVYVVETAQVEWHHSGDDAKARLRRLEYCPYATAEEAEAGVKRAKSRITTDPRAAWNPRTYQGHAGLATDSYGEFYFVFITTRLIDMKGSGWQRPQSS